MPRPLLLISLLALFTLTAHAQEKEVVLVGTMHTVPKIVKKSYQPLLRRAKKYRPQAIYTENPRANDSLSWEYLKEGWSENYKRFYKLADSLQKDFDYDAARFEALISKDFDQLSTADLDVIINSFGYLRDIANYDFYRYIKKKWQ